MGSPSDNRSIDGVWREQGHYVSLSPFPGRFEAFAKLNGFVFDLGVCVLSSGVGIDIDD